MPLISLVGMPGSGKSTVGRQLARHLGWEFKDADAEIERAAGMSVSHYFATHGEQAFRDLEQEVLGSLVTARPQGLVLATGGGAVLRPANRTTLRQGGTVVYLRATVDDLARRLRHDTQRPLLQTDDPLRRLRQMFREREPLYREVADYVVETGRPSVPTLVNMIAMQLELAGIVAQQQR